MLHVGTYTGRNIGRKDCSFVHMCPSTILWLFHWCDKRPGQFCSVECRDQYSILFKSKTVCPCYRTPTQLRFHCYMPEDKEHDKNEDNEKKETKKDDKRNVLRFFCHLCKEKKETKTDDERNVNRFEITDNNEKKETEKDDKNVKRFEITDFKRKKNTMNSKTI